jgi:activator of 2-hydroxyglutaryl-CoA dehydratase
VIRELVGALRKAFSNSHNLPKINRPVPIVLSGGTALPRGFRDRFEAVLKEEPFPLPVSEIRVAANPLHATAKGALLAALAD